MHASPASRPDFPEVPLFSPTLLQRTEVTASRSPFEEHAALTPAQRHVHDLITNGRLFLLPSASMAFSALRAMVPAEVTDFEVVEALRSVSFELEGSRVLGMCPMDEMHAVGNTARLLEFA